jgi:hypothetical protein
MRSMEAFSLNNPPFMKCTPVFLFAILAMAILFVSCSRSVSVHQAANNNYKKCRPIR